MVPSLSSSICSKMPKFSSLFFRKHSIVKMFISNFVTIVYKRSPSLLCKSVSRGMACVASSVDPATRIVWIDLELSGLDIEKDVILEAACIITESNLNEVGVRLNFVVNHPATVLDAMGDWCQENHRKTGLYEEVLRSNLSIQNVEEKIIDHLQKYTVAGKSCIAGNTVYMDRLFVAKYLPKVDQFLHYRIIDVSSIKELCRRWNRKLYLEAPQKVFVHRALEDIIESIAELKYYKENLFKLDDKIIT